ncbi:MAG: hypothetical protein JWM85_21 [Acidimicrobiaceae bacterium]|nr:hypothetical protein [Acidimicrobiaceae bacterium]
MNKRTLAAVMGAVSLCALLLGGSASAATATRRPARVLAVVVTPKVLPAAGGTVSVLVRDQFATTCTLTLVPKTPGFPRTFHCAAGQLATAVKIAKNALPHGQTLRFSVFANGPGGRSPTRTAFVSQATDIGPIGTTLDVHDLSKNVLAVTVTQVIDPASGVDQYTTPNSGDRFVAVDMNLANQSQATISDDANSDTTVIGTDNQAYTADFNSVSQCTNFSNGEFTMLQGGAESGCVVFQLPNGVNVKAVQFSFDSTFLDTAQWNA